MRPLKPPPFGTFSGARPIRGFMLSLQTFSHLGCKRFGRGRRRNWGKQKGGEECRTEKIRFSPGSISRLTFPQVPGPGECERGGTNTPTERKLGGGFNTRISVNIANRVGDKVFQELWKGDRRSDESRVPQARHSNSQPAQRREMQPIPLECRHFPHLSVNTTAQL